MVNEDLVANMRGDSHEVKTFMSAYELKQLRSRVIRVTQSQLASQLIKPDTGQPITMSTLSRWERGDRRVPRWAAMVVRTLADAARRVDKKVQ